MVNIVSENYQILVKKKQQETHEEVYNLTKILQGKNNLISELEKQVKIKSELANDFLQNAQENQETFDLEKEDLTKQIDNYHQEIAAAKIIFEDQRNLITELEEKYQQLESEHENFKKMSLKKTTAIINKQKLESEEAKQLIEELESCLETQIQAKETAENKLSQLTSPATPDYTPKSPLVRLRGFSGSFDEKMKLLEQKNQAAYNDLAIERDDLERELDREREKTEINKNTSQSIIKKLRNELKKTTKKNNDLENDLQAVAEMLNQNWRTIQQEKEINSFLQIRCHELNNKYSQNFVKYRKTNNNLNQERIHHQATFYQLLEQEVENQQLENKVAEFTQRISELVLEIGK